MSDRERGSLWRYLEANMMDGDASCMFSAPGESLLDEICEHVVLWLIERSGVEQAIDEHFLGAESVTEANH